MTEGITLTREELLTAKSKNLVGKRVRIRKVKNAILSQYSFAVGKQGTIVKVVPQDLFPINVKLDMGMTLSFGEAEVELI